MAYNRKGLILLKSTEPGISSNHYSKDSNILFGFVSFSFVTFTCVGCGDTFRKQRGYITQLAGKFFVIFYRRFQLVSQDTVAPLSKGTTLPSESPSVHKVLGNIALFEGGSPALCQ